MSTSRYVNVVSQISVQMSRATHVSFPKVAHKMQPCFHLMKKFISVGVKKVPIAVCENVWVWNNHTRCSETSCGRIFDFWSIRLSTWLPETDDIMHPAQLLCTRMATGNS